MLIEVYSDGSATTEDRPGGYGWVMVIDGKKHSEGNGYMPNASNNDAEIEAAIHGLAAALKLLSSPDTKESLRMTPVEVYLVADSKLVLGWADGSYRFKQLAKIDKCHKLRELMRRLNAKTRHVYGHSGDEHNERCDALANAARKQQQLRPSPEIKQKKRVGPKVKLKYSVLAVGQRNAMLELVEKLDNSEGSHSEWLAKCDCGNTVAVRADSFLRGHKKSCGCIKIKLSRAERALNLTFSSYVKRAETKGIEFTLTKNQFANLIAQNCFYCNQAPIEYTAYSEGPIERKYRFTKHVFGQNSLLKNGIDRANNDIGYIPENCLPCCQKCNMAKGTMSFEEFKKWIARVYEFSYNKKI